MGYCQPYHLTSNITHNYIEHGINNFNSIFDVPAKKRHIGLNNMVIDVPHPPHNPPRPPPQNSWVQPALPPLDNALIDDTSVISSRETHIVRTLHSEVLMLTDNIYDAIREQI